MAESQPVEAEKKLENEPHLYKFFKAAVKMQASDLHLKVGQPPKLRLYGQLKNTTGEIMTAEMLEQMVFEIMSSAQKEVFLKEGTLDFIYSFCELIKDGSVDPKEAYKIAPNIEELKMALKGIRSTTSGIL